MTPTERATELLELARTIVASVGGDLDPDDTLALFSPTIPRVVAVDEDEYNARVLGLASEVVRLTGRVDQLRAALDIRVTPSDRDVADADRAATRDMASRIAGALGDPDRLDIQLSEEILRLTEELVDARNRQAATDDSGDYWNRDGTLCPFNHNGTCPIHAIGSP